MSRETRVLLCPDGEIAEREGRKHKAHEWLGLHDRPVACPGLGKRRKTRRQRDSLRTQRERGDGLRAWLHSKASPAVDKPSLDAKGGTVRAGWHRRHFLTSTGEVAHLHAVKRHGSSTMRRPERRRVDFRPAPSLLPVTGKASRDRSLPGKARRRARRARGGAS